MTDFLILSVAVVAVVLCLPAASAAMTLVEDGRPQCTIVVPHDATEPERLAAAELGKYLKQITQADVPVADAAQGPRILIGASETVQRIAPNVDYPAPGTDGIVIKTVGDDLLLAGARPYGALYAVYTFLQDVVGCRWWAPDAETIPRQPTLTLTDLNTVHRPPFEMRTLRSGLVHRNETFACKLRLTARMNFDMGTHSVPRLLPPGEYFVKHPDWFMFCPEDGDPAEEHSYAGRLGHLRQEAERSETAAEVYRVARETRRLPRQPCMSHPDVVRTIGDAIMAQLKENYAKWPYPPKVVWVTQGDGRYMCRCPRCSAVREREGAQSAVWVEAANEIAGRVSAEYPDVFVGILAYLHTMRPPRTVKPRDNVLVYAAVLDRNHKVPINRIPDLSSGLRRWCDLAGRVYVWDYIANFRNYVKPHPNHYVLAESIRFYHREGVRGLFVQSTYGSAGEFMRMRAWVNAQVMWDPTQNDRRLMQEFLNGYYGAAAPYLQKHIDRLNLAIRGEGSRHLNCFNPSTETWLDLAELNEATRLFGQALDAVGDDETLNYRVRRARLGIDMVWLERYDELRAEAETRGLPFLGPDDPYAAAEEMMQDEFKVDSYREWAGFPEYLGKLRELYPSRDGP